MSLRRDIERDIRIHGPMRIDRYMNLAIERYYKFRDPFGVDGDFITAPEISQMFGEMIGAWCADIWGQLGCPSRFVLAECGPGRGTLMADALRAVRSIAGFYEAARICMIERSEMLKQRQQAALDSFAVHVEWHEDIATLPEDMPIILVANEFLDALPVRQFEYRGGSWHERVIGLGETGELQVGLVPAADIRPDFPASEGEVAELSAAVTCFAHATAARVVAQRGAALFIDYGYAHGYGDSVQALFRHRPVDMLDHIGEADITAHIDFAALARAGRVSTVYGPLAQGDFLRRLGVGVRAEALKKNATDRQAAEIDASLRRLTDPAEMGDLFKVMAFTSDGMIPAGF